MSPFRFQVLTIDDHIGISFAGLTADAKSLGRWMRTEALNNRYTHDTPWRMSTLATDLGNKLQACIQGYNKRPYGVGMLIAGYDVDGPHIMHMCPSANVYPCKAMAIGARSQSAKTYLEKHLDEFKACELEELVKHALRALRDTLPNEVDLNNKNLTLAVVGKGQNFVVYEDESVDSYLALIEGEERRGAAQMAAADEEAAGDDDDEDQPAGGEGMDTA